MLSAVPAVRTHTAPAVPLGRGRALAWPLQAAAESGLAGSAGSAGLRVWLGTTTVIPETPAKAGVPPLWVDGIPGWV